MTRCSTCKYFLPGNDATGYPPFCEWEPREPAPLWLDFGGVALTPTDIAEAEGECPAWQPAHPHPPQAVAP